MIKSRLDSLDEDSFLIATSIEFKGPTMMLIISIIAGFFGVDSFMLGDIGMGVLKLLTVGLCGILTIIDWFSISKRTKENNFNKFMMMI